MDREITADDFGRFFFLGRNLHLLLRVVLEQEGEKAINVPRHKEAFRVFRRRVVRLDHFLQALFDGMALGVGKNEIVVAHGRAIQDCAHGRAADLDPDVGPWVVFHGAIGRVRMGRQDKKVISRDMARTFLKTNGSLPGKDVMDDITRLIRLDGRFVGSTAFIPDHEGRNRGIVTHGNVAVVYITVKDAHKKPPEWLSLSFKHSISKKYISTVKMFILLERTAFL